MALNSLLIASAGLAPGPLRPLVVAMRGFFDEVEQLVFGNAAGGTGQVSLRPKLRPRQLARPRPAWRPPLPIIPKADLEEDEALLVCGAI